MKNMKLTMAAKKHQTEINSRVKKSQETSAKSAITIPNHLKYTRLVANSGPKTATRYAVLI
jgi:hypothetical protein